MTDDAKGVVCSLSEDSFDEEMDRALSVRSSVIKRIQEFESHLLELDGKAKSLSDGDSSSTASYPIDELVEEEKTLFRSSLYDELNHLFSSLTGPEMAPSMEYEEALYSLLVDRMQRTFGYYQALSRASEEVRRRNIDIGDPKAMSLSIDSTQSVLSKLDDVDFVRKLCTRLKMHEKDTEDIVQCVIQRAFRGKHG